MYGIWIDGNARLQTNDILREYARLEYRTEDVDWLRAAVKAAVEARHTRRHLGRFERRRRPAHVPVACKGSPRRQLQEVPSPG